MPVDPSPKNLPGARWLAGVVIFLCLTWPSAAATGNWQIVTAHGRQYIPLRNLRDFYGLANVASDEPNQVRLKGARGVLDFRNGSRECAINGVRIWLSFPALQIDEGWMVSRMDVAKTIEPAMRPAIIKGLDNVVTVVLDAGHGGHDGGAASRYGLEKTFALDIARRVKGKLEQSGYRVVLTRTGDTFIPLQERPAVANAIQHSVFVSIHFNASQQGDAATGIEVFCIAPRGAPSTNDNYITWASLREEPGHELDMASFALGRAVHTALMGHLHEIDRGLKRARFAVIRAARVPAILVECGFLTNPGEARAIATDAHRNEIASAIAEGINDYQLLATLHKAPKSLADYDRSIETTITLREDHEAGVNNEMEPSSGSALPPPVAEATPAAEAGETLALEQTAVPDETPAPEADSRKIPGLAIAPFWPREPVPGIESFRMPALPFSTVRYPFLPVEPKELPESWPPPALQPAS